MKKLFFLFLAAAALLCACGASSDGSGYKVAIVQQLDHTSLDEIRLAVESELEVLSAEMDISIEYKDFNGQNDPTLLGQIGAQIATHGYDAVIPIGTLAAQTMVTATDASGIPIIYAAISDPCAAGLTDIPHVTGTSDALDTSLILEMMLAVDPDIRTVGLLYSNSEPNSEAPVALAKSWLADKGIRCLEKTGNTADEILSAAGTLVDRCDAVFTPTDNAVMRVAGVVAETLSQAGIPYYAGADSFVVAGAFATCGVNYAQLGTYTAHMTVDILLGGDIPVYHTMEGGIITVNTTTAKRLGLTYDVFHAMSHTVRELDGT